MGLTATDVDLLLDMNRHNPGISSIATVGRLSLYLHPKQLRRLQSIFPRSKALYGYKWGDYADKVLCDITGASEIVSIDMSDYQESSIVHDMNKEMCNSRPDLESSFDLVIDGGSLEHVYNFPVAVRNVMFLVRQGGHVLTANPANNLCGHGFYQFTPELMHRLYAPNNGFRVSHVLLTESRHLSVEMDAFPRSFEVVDPASLGRRIMLRSRWPIMIRTVAQRIGAEIPAEMSVQQSDYVMAWSGAAPSTARKGLKTWVRTIFRYLPMTMQSRLADIVSRPTLSNPKAMRRWRGAIAG